MPWAATLGLDKANYAAGLAHLNAVKHDLFVFDLHVDGEVAVREKHVHNPHPFSRRIEHFRARLYRDHLRQALKRGAPSSLMTIGVVVGDIARDIDPRLPVFTYQRRTGDAVLLLPDVELLEFDFYEQDGEPSDGDAQVNRIVFAGSSTGRSLDEEAVRDDQSERLRFAARFVGDPQVEVTIGHASECRTPQARAALEAKPYFRRVEWADQLTRRFVLSLDGNGATCSRVVRTLRSRSCLVKGASDWTLFYFPGLLPWAHFIPVADEHDLARLAPLLTRPDFPSGAMVEGANHFCREHLSREAVNGYTSELLRTFNDTYLRRL